MADSVAKTVTRTIAQNTKAGTWEHESGVLRPWVAPVLHHEIDGLVRCDALAEQC